MVDLTKQARKILEFKWSVLKSYMKVVSIRAVKCTCA